MRALENRYERMLRDARLQTADAEARARSALAGLSVISSEMVSSGSDEQERLARASAAAESATRSHDAAKHEALGLRRRLASCEAALGESRTACAERVKEVEELQSALRVTRQQLEHANGEAETERALNAGLRQALEGQAAKADGMAIELGMARREKEEVEEEKRRLRAHAQQLLEKGDAPIPAAPLPAALSESAAFESLRAERDSLLSILSEIRKVGEATPVAASVRVAGGQEKLPDYIKKLTASMPPALCESKTRRAAPNIHLAHLSLATPTLAVSMLDPNAPAEQEEIKLAADMHRSRARAWANKPGQTPWVPPGGQSRTPPSEPGSHMHFFGRIPSKYREGVLLHEKPAPSGTTQAAQAFAEPATPRSPALAERGVGQVQQISHGSPEVCYYPRDVRPLDPHREYGKVPPSCNLMASP